jgi:hypothetical protein
MATNEMTTGAPVDPRQRRQVRRTALLLGLLALAIYASFIVFSILRASH